jgi:ketosteroid isomerase-like protein
MYRLTRHGLLFLILIPGCQPPDIENQSRQVRAIIETHNADLARWYSAGQMDSVALLFAVDARQMGPNTEPLEGRDAILEFWEQVSGLGTWTFDLDTREVTAYGPLAVERGTYTLRFQPGDEALPGMAASADTGNYVVQWRLEGGRWLIVNDIATSQRSIDALCKMQTPTETEY